jgi:protein TonB
MKKTITFLILLYTICNFSQNVTIDNNIYDIKGIELEPEFPGGKEKLKDYVNESLLKTGFETPINTKVETKPNAVSIFIVEKDGSLSDIKVYGKIDSLKSNEVIRILKKSPIWKPGKQNGTIVRVMYALPIN